MDFLSVFEVVQESGEPPIEYLIIFSIFHLIIIIVTFFVYKNLNYHIKTSLKGPSVDSKVILPFSLNEIFRAYFGGIFFFEMSNLITHVSGILTKDDMYYLIGSEDFVTLIGFILITIAIHNMWNQLNISKENTQVSFKNYPILIAFLMAIFFLIIIYLNDPNKVIEVHFLIITSYTVTMFAVIFSMVKTYSQNNDNPLISIRKKILITALIFENLLVYILPIFFLPRNGYYPTRNNEVEYLLASLDFLSILLIILMMSIVILPKPLLKLLGIDKQKFIKYADPRFDHPYTYETWIATSEDDIIGERSEEYIMAYLKDESLIFNNLTEYYTGQIVHFSQLDEKILSKLFLPTSDIILMDAHFSRTSSNILNSISNNYLIHVEYTEDGVIFRQNYLISSDKVETAVIVIIPSYWNNYRKLWLVQFKPKLTLVMIDFLKKFKLYLEEIAYSKKLNALVLKFPIKDGEPTAIPKISEGVEIPDPNYLVSL